MKRPVLPFAMAFVAACGIGYRLTRAAHTPAALPPVAQAEHVGSIPPPAIDVASIPVTTNAAGVTQAAPMTTNLRRVFDSPDAMETIDDIRDHGTTDERDWAVRLLGTCAGLFGLASLPPVVDPDASSNPATASVSKELQMQKDQAFKQLAERCKGVKSLRVAERATLRRELLEPAASYHSALRELDFLSTEVRDGRWSEPQAQLITKSLYSGDPVLAQAAFHAMLGTIDTDAPGGKDRNDAFMLAVGGIFDKAPLTQYDRWQACYTMGWWCGANGRADMNIPAPSAAVLQLANKYTAAVNAHLDARSLLAIR